MRGHRSTVACRSIGVGRAAALALVLVLSPTPTAWLGLASGGDDRGAGPGMGSPRTLTQVALTADKVRMWDEQSVRYVVLEGHAAAFKGDDGFRADRAVARIVTISSDRGTTRHQVNLYLEGNVRRTEEPRKSRPDYRESWTTTGVVDVSAPAAADLVVLPRAPANLAILAKAFPPKRATEAGPKPTAAAAPAAPAAVAAPKSATPPLSGRPRLGDRAAAPAAEPAAAPRPPAGSAAPSQGELPVIPEASLPPLDVVAAPRAGPLPAATDRAVAPAQYAPDAAPADAAVTPKPTPKPKPTPDERPIRFRDPNYKPVQFVEKPGFRDDPVPARPPGGAPVPAPPDDFGPADAPPVVEAPGRRDDPAPPPRAGGAKPDDGRVFELEPLPGRPPADPNGPKVPDAPILLGTSRETSIYARTGPNFQLKVLPTTEDGTVITVISGGVNIVTNAPKLGTVDVESDSAVIWRRKKPEGSQTRIGPNGEVVESSEDPMEVYLEGHVVFRQDRRLLQGRDDQTTYLAKRAYYDYRADRFVGLEAEVAAFSPGLISPFRTKTPRVDAFHPLVSAPDGRIAPSAFQEIHAEQTVSTGSRFANPGYRFTSQSLDLKKVLSDNAPPTIPGDAPDDTQRTTWRIDARQNFFFIGPVPAFYWPRYQTDIDDIDPPLRQIGFNDNNYFGQQLLLDFNGFKLLGIRKPAAIDVWNVDVDYLSARGVALGTEIGWFGDDPVYDVLDPYHRKPNTNPSFLTGYFGYTNLYGLRDRGIDDLGGGPAVVTNNIAAGNIGLQRTAVPAFQQYRGLINSRTMQSINITGQSDPFEDFHVNFETGYLSDRQFLEEYYKRLFDIGLDHESLVYGIKQYENHAFTAHAEINPNSFNTETQWAPKLDYYRLGDSLFNNMFTYFGHTGVDYGVTNTAIEVNNPHIFAFIPYDPISNTSGVFKTGRAYTAHELDMPINLGVVRIKPYVQGQAVGWNQQIDGQAVGRVWGAAGAQIDVMAHNAYPGVESELLNVHGLNHKIDFMGDYRDAYSNVNLNHVGVQDDLDDNTYEFVRRYFALTNYAGGLLPAQYDPRFLILRRALSPITDTTDVQASIQTLHLGIHQRLQTKRGPEGKRRVIDYMVFDLDTTYFPYANRDNFGKPFGQNMYNYEWYIGDRTSIVSYGWFEFWNIGGNPLYKVISRNKANPFGMEVITTGININRPPRGNIFIGYSIIDTGPIQTSALNVSYSYWMSPKYYTTFGTSYDFGNSILLGANFSVTRIGKDFLLSMGLNVDPQRQSYMYSFQLTPRLSPNLRLGSGGALGSLDPRYAPVE